MVARSHCARFFKVVVDKFHWPKSVGQECDTTVTFMRFPSRSKVAFTLIWKVMSSDSACAWCRPRFKYWWWWKYCFEPENLWLLCQSNFVNSNWLFVISCGVGFVKLLPSDSNLSRLANNSLENSLYAHAIISTTSPLVSFRLMKFCLGFHHIDSQRAFDRSTSASHTPIYILWHSLNRNCAICESFPTCFRYDMAYYIKNHFTGFPN